MAALKGGAKSLLSKPPSYTPQSVVRIDCLCHLYAKHCINGIKGDILHFRTDSPQKHLWSFTQKLKAVEKKKDKKDRK